ncbi:MAG: hypothetical protein PHD76_07855 [Methylacidiphilales bacterium]|nr:hypothetical protein [Candidatus Methylacidiphilales bacterium]
MMKSKTRIFSIRESNGSGRPGRKAALSGRRGVAYRYCIMGRTLFRIRVSQD